MHDQARLSQSLLALVPVDGSSIGNQSLFEQLSAAFPDLSQAAFVEARDALIAQGVLQKGRGRGGSVKRSEADGSAVAAKPAAVKKPAHSAEKAAVSSMDDLKKTLWATADKLRANMDAAEYKHIVLGLIFLKYISDSFASRRAELERKLAAEQARDELRITRMAGDALRVGVASDATFDFGKDNLRSEALGTYAKIASVLKDYDKTVVHIVGHTDSVGTDSYNQGLSERRASAVASYLMQQGMPADRIRQEGRGEREPVASNDGDEGRRRNRRVDIVIKPVIEGQEQQAWAPPPYLGA